MSENGVNVLDYQLVVAGMTHVPASEFYCAAILAAGKLTPLEIPDSCIFMTKPQADSITPVHKEQAETQSPSQPPAKDGEVREIGGPKGPEPTRYGDWEKKGRCIDF